MGIRNIVTSATAVVDINTNTLQVGDVIEGEVCKGGHEVFLKTYDEVVSLTNPRRTWGPDGVVINKARLITIDIREVTG